MHPSFLLHQVIAWTGFNFFLFPLFSSYENEDILIKLSYLLVAERKKDEKVTDTVGKASLYFFF